MSTPTDKITLAETKDALLRSGYLLENRLETALRSKGHYVEANSPYLDPDTAKSRELDVYAMTALKAGPEDFDFVFRVLLIECVNNPQPLAFFTKNPQVPFLHHSEVKLAGIPVKVHSPGARRAWEPLVDYLKMDKYHHYCRGRVATQFCSFVAKQKKREKEWMATHDDNHFDALRKLSAAVDFFADKHFKSWYFRGRESVNLEFYYPVIVVQGDLLDVRQTKKDLKVITANHIQYRRSAFVGGKETSYQIDVVTERYFPRYLRIVDRELSKTARLLRRRHRVVRLSIDKIVRTAKPLRSPEKVRVVMDVPRQGLQL